MTDRISAIERLSELLDEGKLTRDEYEALKREVMRGEVSETARPRGEPARADEMDNLRTQASPDSGADIPATESSRADPPGPATGSTMMHPSRDEPERVEGPVRDITPWIPFDSLQTKKNVTAIFLWLTAAYWGLEALVAVDFVLPEPFWLGIGGPPLVLELGRWYRLLIVGTGIAFVIWSYAAHSNLSRLGRTGMRFPDHATVWWWLVPIGNLYMPYRVNFETARGTFADLNDDDWLSHPLPTVATWWSITFVAGIVLNALSAYLLSEYGLATRSGAIHAFGPLMLAIAASTAAQMVSKITAEQTAQRLRQASKYPAYHPPRGLSG